jgi:hypothetical protein
MPIPFWPPNPHLPHLPKKHLPPLRSNILPSAQHPPIIINPRLADIRPIEINHLTSHLRFITPLKAIQAKTVVLVKKIIKNVPANLAKFLTYKTDALEKEIANHPILQRLTRTQIHRIIQ